MNDNDTSAMQGVGDAFDTTDWTEIFRAKTSDTASYNRILGTLSGRYWRPVYYYLRRRGHDNETAKDLTQGFFGEIILGRDLIRRADREKGRFRVFLLVALNRYVASMRRAQAARKRSPEAGLVSIDAMNVSDLPEPAHGATPEEAFHYAWATALLDSVIAEVERGCRESGMTCHWRVFEARVLDPIFRDAEPASLPAICTRLEIDNEAIASNMVITVKRRFQAALKRHIRKLVGAESQVEEEIRDLMEILSKPRAGS